MSQKDNLREKNNNNFKFQMKNINIPFAEKNAIKKSETRDKTSIKKNLFGIINKSNKLADENLFELQKKKITENSLILFDKEHSNSKSNEHLNSFSSIFRRDHEEIKGIQRVFRKSIIFLVLSLFSFGILVNTSINLFQANPFALVISAFCFIVFTNIFYIIVADKSYIWLNLILQFIIILIFHSLLKLSFSPITLITTLFIILLSYLSYTELEKVQLGSRLFTIGQITKESTAVLLTLITILLSLGLYNSMISNGFQKVFTETVLNNQSIFNKYVLGKTKSDITLNSLFGITSINQVTGNPLTFGQFLTEHFRNNKEIILDSETSTIREKCIVDYSKDACADDVAITRVKNARLEEWKAIAYPKINYNLDTPLDSSKFIEVTKQYYSNQVCVIEKGEDCQTNKEIPSLKTDNEAALSTKAKISDALTKDINISNSYLKYFAIDRSNLIPLIFTLILFCFLTIIKGIIGYLVFVFSWIFWQILKLFGFVKIEVETVEAEVVSI